MDYEQLKEDFRKLTKKQILYTLIIVTYFSLILWAMSQPSGLIMFITINIIIIIVVWRMRNESKVRVQGVQTESHKEDDTKAK